MRVGLFDSGMGGLTVLKALKNKYPNNEYIYFGDNKNLPYGSKTKEELLKLSMNAINFLLSKKVDIIVIACGTVSSNVYAQLKQIYNIKIYDILTPTIDYINNNSIGKVALMATQATVDSHIFKKYGVLEIACPLLVPYIENKINDDIDIILSSYLDNINVDTIILGCTHYPILKDKIVKHTNARLINMGEVLSERIKLIDSKESVQLYFSDNIDKDKINKIIDFEYEMVIINA